MNDVKKDLLLGTLEDIEQTAKNAREDVLQGTDPEHPLLCLRMLVAEALEHWNITHPVLSAQNQARALTSFLEAHSDELTPDAELFSRLGAVLERFK